MKKITYQDIFNTAWQAFVIEGKPPALKQNITGVGGGFECVYLTEDGHKCAIGLVLPDGHPAQLFRGAAGELIDKYPELWDDSNVSFYNLNDIQISLHDDHIDINTSTWKEGINLREKYLQVAKDFNLTVPE